MTMKEFLEYREPKFDDDVDDELLSPEYRGYKLGWTLAVKNIRMVLEQHGFNLEIPLE